MLPLESRMPAGWAFYGADASLMHDNAWSARYNRPKITTVTLIRNEADRKWWHSLDEEGKDTVELYVKGKGPDFESALLNAIDLCRTDSSRPNN